MLGWKTINSTVEKVDFEDAKNSIISQGFELLTDEDNCSILKKSGTTLTLKGSKAPQKLWLVKRDDGVEVQLKYDVFVLFDTGDLQLELERLTEVIREYGT